MFEPVDPKVDFPKLEEKILAFWKEHKIFEKSLEKDAPKGEWTFLDGPPFITGMPHYGSLLSSLPKDMYPRFYTMKGYRVRRVWGWDCHGLPAENKVETALGLTSKREIEEKIGVERFISECKLYVNNVSKEWEWYVDHIGRWVDFKNAYRTMDMSYMESVMWVFKQMYEKGYIYKGLRVSLYCPHCATPISNFEVAMDADNYKEIVDPATTYKYQLEEEKDTFILAWSTTPWNKIVTPALAVNPSLSYVKIKQDKEYYILAETTLSKVEGAYTVVATYKGEELVGKKYIPHYNYYQVEKGKRAFEIISGEFVTAEEGTGVVTIAAYGEEDLVAMQTHNIHIEMHVDEEGTIKENVPLFGGMYYLKANKAVNEDLRNRGLIYKEYEYPHNVPLCWRCHTRLYYAPQDAWYVKVSDLKEKMKQSNISVNWVPSHFKHGRFEKSLEYAPDWNISRSRYWGSPVPVWECNCGERFVPGSIEELENRAGKKVNDLHKPFIDEIIIECKKCHSKVKRVPEVLDSWIEAGSASFGERHYPFTSQESLESFYPPDFIGEYTGQIRAWFYVLHVIANALSLRKEDNVLSRNVLVEGVILGTDGRKMSKNFGNYPDPMELIKKYGGDALRLYLLGSPVMNGEDIVISEEQYRNQVKGLLLIYWNVYNFFVSNANSDKWEPSNNFTFSTKVLDVWIISRLHSTIAQITECYEQFNSPLAVTTAEAFMNDLSLWYVRRSRDRVGPSASDREDKKNAYETLWYVLKEYSKLLAPLIPFITEEIYKNLSKEESVHLSSWWNNPSEVAVNTSLEEEMKYARELVSHIHAFRKTHEVKVRIPLKTLSYNGPVVISEDLLAVVKEETNVYSLVFRSKKEFYEIEGDFSIENQDVDAGVARDIIRKVQEERKKLGTTLTETIHVTLPSWPVQFEEDIKKKALISSLQKGEFSVKRT